MCERLGDERARLLAAALKMARPGEAQIEDGRLRIEGESALETLARFLQRLQTVQNLTKLIERGDHVGVPLEGFPESLRCFVHTIESMEGGPQLIRRVGKLRIEVGGSRQMATGRKQIAFALETQAVLEVYRRMARIERQGSLEMGGRLIVPAELGEGRAKVQMRVDMVRLSLDDRLELGRRGGKVPLSEKGHSQPEAGKARAQFDCEDATVAVHRRRKLFRHEVGVAEIPVIGGNPSFEADRLFQELDRLRMIAPLAGDDAKEMKDDMIARVRGYQGA